MRLEIDNIPEATRDIKQTLRKQLPNYADVFGQVEAEMRSLVDDINIKRRAAYTSEARTQSVTVDQVAFVAGCRNILRTAPGEKYQAPDGSWKIRAAGAPTRDSRCP